ncbi:hypothetical protein NFI96_031191, partial [Prochilodus magdalenae]
SRWMPQILRGMEAQGLRTLKLTLYLEYGKRSLPIVIPKTIINPSLCCSPYQVGLMEEISEGKGKTEPTLPDCPPNKEYVPSSMRRLFTQPERTLFVSYLFAIAGQLAETTW